MIAGEYEGRSKNLKEIMKMFCPSAGSPFVLLVSLESEDAIVGSDALVFRRVHLSRLKGWRLKRTMPFSLRTNRKR